MSGCGCGQPVIINGTQAPARVDVETLLLCDVLADGTVAATALVEPIYDTSTGDRVGTRTVDPTTGAAYTVQGTLQQCPASSQCPDCQTLLLCDVATVPTAPLPLTATGYQVRPDQDISGAPRYGSDADAEAIWSGQTVSVPGAAAGGADPGAHTHYGVTLGAGAPECGDLDPAGDVEITATVTYTNNGPGGAWDWYGRLSLWDGTTLVPGADNFGQGSGVFFPAGSTRTATITGTVPVASLLAGDVTVEFNLETGADGGDINPKTWTVTGGALTAVAAVTGCTGQATPFLRHLCRSCDGTATITDTALDGTTPYTVAGTVGACDTSGPACDSPTTPVTTVGLCLADGTPIAVTVVRDCSGTVTSEGWINLSTGAWTAGAVPVGTVACGDSRSITVSGTFCDVDAAGEVVGLVLVEYTYDDAGAISAVRLVDAVTGTTYTPTGTVTTCPAGVAQPEQDVVQLCDVQADGTVTPIVRDYRRDENGAIVGHSDYLLDGTAYAATGTVGLCQPAACETEQLCDVQKDVPAVLPAFGAPTEAWQDLANGVRWMRRGADAALPGGWYTADTVPPERFDFDRPVSVTYNVRFSGPTAAPLRIPDGWYLDSLNTTQHAWNAAMRMLSPTASATQAGESTFRIETQTARSMTAPAVVGTQAAGQSSQYGQITVTTDVVTLFLRTLCRDSAGTVTVTDTLPDGVTLYNVLGTAGRCPETPPSSCRDCETLVLCDGGADEPATITGAGASTGTLSSGVTWNARGSAAAAAASYDGGAGEGSWWPAIYSFPNATIGNHTWSFDRPSWAEFSVYMRWVNYTGTSDPTNPNPRNATQVPTNVEPVYLPDGYHYDPITHVVSVDASRGPAGNEPCANLTAPTLAESARFRTTEPVSSVRTRYLGVRVANCGVFGSQRVGAFTVTPAGQFLRHVCRDCEGTVSSVTDTLMDGTTPYVVVGAVGTCADLTQCDQAVLSECTYRLPETVTGFDTAPAAFPGCWLGTATNPTYEYGDRVTSWEGTYQTSTGTVSGLGFTLAGIPLDFTAFTPALPANPAQSPVDYVGTATVNGVTITLRALAGNGLATATATQLMLNPGDRVGIEFSEPVQLTVTTSAFADPPTPHNERLCGVLAETVPWEAVKLADCQGVITTVDATTREPLPATATVTCDDSCCDPVQVCISATTTETIEFISNEAQVDNDTIDTTWTWTNQGDANGPAAAATWYQMYRARYGFAPAAWSVVDSDTDRPAGWISPHPNGATATTGAPGEGPTLSGTTANPMRWWARAAFSLPAAAAPDSIRVQITVLNADQVASRFRLNTGAWTALPANATYNGVPYTFGPGVVPGAQPGTNTLYFEVLETVDNNPGNGAGVMAHFIVTYDVPGLGQRSWTRLVCCDGSVSYIDENGQPQEELPPSSSVIPCGCSAQPMILCDDNGAFIRHVAYLGDQVVTTDTDLNGSTYAPVGPVHSC